MCGILMFSNIRFGMCFFNCFSVFMLLWVILILKLWCLRMWLVILCMVSELLIIIISGIWCLLCGVLVSIGVVGLVRKWCISGVMFRIIIMWLLLVMVVL